MANIYGVVMRSDGRIRCKLYNVVLIFFTKTYNADEPVTHVGIYVGDNMMIHCGNPIQYANITSAYWTELFYAFGRLN